MRRVLFFFLVVGCKRDPVVVDCGRFEVHATFVRDRTSHFDWQRTAAPEMDWPTADAYCKSIGMSLPSSGALSDILPLDACAFPDVDAGRSEYWSATEEKLPIVGKYLQNNTDDMVYVDGPKGFQRDARSGKHRVRCTRNRP